MSGVSFTTAQFKTIAAGVDSMLRAARIPGGAISIVVGDRAVFAAGFGYRDLRLKKRVTADTAYPIASTTKAMNAALLGMLVEQGHLDWDAPVRTYLPNFRLEDELASCRATLRDLITMRTGLPRHDWVWWDNPGDRAQLFASMAHLQMSADFRTRFQYSNLSTTAAGHVAEVVMQTSWETLIERRLLRPLGMRRTRCSLPSGNNITRSYHEDARRRFSVSEPCRALATAPSGGAIYSTVNDMTRWLLFNLNGGVIGKRRLMQAKTLEQIHAPQVVIGQRPLAALPADGTYGLGWVIDSYHGYKRVSHGGYLHDVNSFVMFFPELHIGIVSFANFGAPRVAEPMGQHAVDVLLKRKSPHTIENKLVEYEGAIERMRLRRAEFARVPQTRPSYGLSEYCGEYTHDGYGRIDISRRGHTLHLRRYGMHLPMQHWHYDVWIVQDSDEWPIHQPHPFDAASPIQFHLDAVGKVASLSVHFESEVPPIVFKRQQGTSTRKI